MTKKGDVRIEYVALDDLAKAPRNPKTHDLEMLGDSIDRFGFVQPLLVDERSGRLVAGHGRLETLVRARAAGQPPPERVRVEGGAWMVPVIRGVSFDNEKEADAYLLADNRLVERGGWDEAALTEMLAGIQQGADAALKGIGWSEQEVAKLLANADPTAQVVRKQNAQEKLGGYLDNEVRRIILFFTGANYEVVVQKLDAIIQANADIENHTDAFLWLLAHWEKTSA